MDPTSGNRTVGQHGSVMANTTNGENLTVKLVAYLRLITKAHVKWPLGISPQGLSWVLGGDLILDEMSVRPQAPGRILVLQQALVGEMSAPHKLGCRGSALLVALWGSSPHGANLIESAAAG